ncbi:MAG: hypothetical protein ACRD8W_09675 [Nitrososphaeraceae archaeon]
MQHPETTVYFYSTEYLNPFGIRKDVSEGFYALHDKIRIRVD